MIIFEKWTHITYTYDPSTYIGQLYINGQLELSAKGSGPLQFPTEYFVLGKSGDNNRAFNGYMYNFNLFNTVLTPNQISKIYSFK